MKMKAKSNKYKQKSVVSDRNSRHHSSTRQSDNNRRRTGVSSFTTAATTSSKTPNHHLRRRRLDQKISNLFSLLPLDLFESICGFLCWKEIDSMSLTCKQWNQLLLDQSKDNFEWKNTFFTAENALQGLEKIRLNTKGFLNTRFSPSLLVLMVSSSCTKAFKQGQWWIDVLKILEKEQQLPKQCALLCFFSSFGLVGTDGTSNNQEAYEVEEEAVQEPGVQDKQIRFSITCAHLPDTKIDFVSFDRKTLRREADTLENPFPTHSSQSSSFLLFSSNPSSAESILPLLKKWQNTTCKKVVVVGGILPFQDRCQPIAYSSSITNVSKVTRGKRRYAIRHDQTNSRQTQFGTNVVVRLTGRVGIKPFCSSGFEIMSPVLQKCPDQMLNQHRHHHHHQQRLPYEMHSLSYDRVLYQNEVHHLAEILRDHRRGSISLPFDGEEGTFFNIYSSSSKQILEKLFHKDYDNLNTNSCVDIENDHTIERIEMVLYTPNHEIISLGTHWKDNMYGVFAMQNATTARKAYQQSLVQLKQDQDQEGYHFLGAFMVICCLKGQNLYQETSVESHLFQQMFPTLPFTGCFSGGEIGPVSLPHGRFVSSKYQVQSNTTCGAMFYYY